MREAKVIRAACLFGMLGVTACSEPTTPPYQVTRAARSLLLSGDRPKNLRDEYLAIAQRAPGFAGLWVGDDGRIVVSFTRPQLSTSARAEAVKWLRDHGRSDLATRTLVSHPAKYDYTAMVAFLEIAKSTAIKFEGVNTFAVDEMRGKVLVGVSNRTWQGQVRAALARSSIPADAWTVDVMAPAPDVGLWDYQDTLMGGFQISRGAGACSIGFVGYAKDGGGNPDPNVRIITTASHCTSDQTQVLGDLFGQPTIARAAGIEVAEAPLYSGCGSYPYCRYADVAVIQVFDSVWSMAAGVAKSSATVSPNNPPYNGLAAYTGSGTSNVVLNETITKVGSSSGQTTGRVDKSCVDRQSTITPGIWTLCMMHALANVIGGDSGGTVYIPLGGGSWTPRAGGVISQGDVNSLYFSKATDVDAALGYAYKFLW
jgi:hypothetical protein